MLDPLAASTTAYDFITASLGTTQGAALGSARGSMAPTPGIGAYRPESRSPGSKLALCLWLPTFELRLELVRSPGLDSTSVALLDAGQGARRTIWQISERAATAGVMPGMTVSKAVGLCPSLTLLEPDPAHYDAAMGEMLETLSGLSPVVEPAGRGRVFVGMDGLGRLYGSPRRQIDTAFRTLFQVFPRPLVAATRAGWAVGKFGAWVAAVESQPGRPTIVAPNELTSFLSRCPVTALPVAPLTVERLQRLEIHTLGELCQIPEPAVVEQFGRDGRDAFTWASGRRIDRVRPWHRPRPIRVLLDFPTPVGQAGLLYGALDRLLERALQKPERRGRSVQGARIGAQLEGGGSWTAEAVLRESTAIRDRIGFALRSKMDLATPPRAVETLSLEFFEFGVPSSQEDLFDRRSENGRAAAGRSLESGQVPFALAEAVRELKLKIGYSPLYRVVELDPWSRFPERRHGLLNFDP